MIAMIASTALFSISPAVAQKPPMPSFRIDTDIYTDLKKAPVKQTLTLFRDGAYYDFGSEADGIVTLVQPASQQIVLLDQRQKVRTEISFAGLQTEIDRAAAQAPTAMTSITIQAISDSSEGKLLTVGNEDLTYACTVEIPPDLKMAEQYAEFADWSSRLNAAYPPNLPPYVRLSLNELVKESRAIPKKITRSAYQHVVYSISNPIWELTAEDNVRIEKVQQMLQQFKSVPVKKFWSGLK